MIQSLNGAAAHQFFIPDRFRAEITFQKPAVQTIKIAVSVKQDITVQERPGEPGIFLKILK